MKKYGYLFGISFFIIVIGILLMIIDINSLEVIDGLHEKFPLSNKIYEYDGTNKVYIKYALDKVNIVSNDNIDGLKIEISYYEDYDNVSIKETLSKDQVTLEIDDFRNYHFYKVLGDLMDSLSQRKLYNYSLLYDAHVTVYVNTNYLKNVIING